MDRVPLPAPFPVGARVRFIGTDCVWTERNGERIPIVEPGMVVEIVRASDGRRGTLALEYIDDDGEEIRDRTLDGCSVYEVPGVGGRIIWPSLAQWWERVS